MRKMTLPNPRMPGKSRMLVWLSLMLLGAFTFYLNAAAAPSYEQAMALAKEGKTDEAVAAIKQIMAQNPESDNKGAHIRLGLIYFKADQNQNALDQFDKAVAINADSPMAYYFQGLIYEKMAVNKADPAESKSLKQKALNAWQNYLVYTPPDRKRSESHKNIGISIEESIKRARQHIEVLNKEILDESK